MDWQRFDENNKATWPTENDGDFLVVDRSGSYRAAKWDLLRQRFMITSVLYVAKVTHYRPITPPSAEQDTVRVPRELTTEQAEGLKAAFSIFDPTGAEIQEAWPFAVEHFEGKAK